MSLEIATYINQLDSTNPKFNDFIKEADDHMRLIKSVLQNTFPNVSSPILLSEAGGILTLDHPTVALTGALSLAGYVTSYPGVPTNDQVLAWVTANTRAEFIDNHALTAITVTDAAQSAITSLGVLTHLIVVGAITASNGIDKLSTLTGAVRVAGSAAPTAGQTLVATNGTTAGWATPAGGSGELQTDASNNLFAGTDAGLSLTFSSADNILLGAAAGRNIAAGDDNIILGVSAGFALTGGSGHNLMMGNFTGDSLTTGFYNILLGRNAGTNFNTTSERNVALGQSAGPSSLTVENNQLYIHNANGIPLIGGDFVSGITRLSGAMRLTERADHIETPTATFGEVWCRNDVPNVLVYTDDAGTDHDLNGSGAGHWVLLDDWTPTAVTERDFTWDETLYSAIRIELEGIQPSTDTNPMVQVGHTDGATILNNTSDYKSTYRNMGSDTAWTVSVATDGIELTPSGQTVDASGVAGMSGTVELIGGADPNTGVILEGKVTYRFNATDIHAYHTQGFVAPSAKMVAFDTVRLTWDGGTATFATHGSVRYYGLKNA